ncbi:MAG: septal ring lytic transglycosylase RlpA family protein [Pseudomonadales bacterium]|nr:septal ring lytic transglycosylase RlpA family protein [Pseudomonadales bacterium]
MIRWSDVTGMLVLGLAVFLTACVGPASSGTASNAGRYDMKNDSPLLEPFDISSVKPVVPVVERRTIAGNMSPYTVNGATYRVMKSEEGYAETGLASWYGRKFHGHKTSNGEIYDMFQLSAAHKSLPIPSYLNVTNLDNGRSVMVRVNDRGPFHGDRIVDLSYAAATILGYADKGVARVRIEAVMPGQAVQLAAAAASDTARTSRAPLPEAVTTTRQQYLQIGAFSNLGTAQAALRKLATLTSLTTFIFSDASSARGSGAVLHRVRLGPLDENMDLTGLVKAIVDAGFGTPFKVTQ